MDRPEITYRTIVNDSGDPGYVNRLLVGTPATGLVRIEWLQARMGQVIPVNWSWVQAYEYLSGYFPLRYQVADAQNLIVRHAIEKDFEWLLLWEHDVIPQPDALLRLNDYIREAKYPVVSGLYFTRSQPAEPLIFRGKGTGAYYDWEMGDVVWCDGVPTGFLLVHVGLLRAMWDESEEYQIKGQTVRRVFDTPRDLWFDPETAMWNTTSGTSDLDWCERIVRDGYFEKAGWRDFAPDPKWPFPVDTQLFCKHINTNGEQFP